MTRTCILAALALTAVARPGQAQPAAQDEPTAKSRIVSVGLFKNGLAVVKREIEIPAVGGTFRLDATPDAVHGTFWIESSASVEVALRMREVAVDPKQVPEGNLQEIFAGKKVTVHFTGNKLPAVTGTVPWLKPTRTEDLPTSPYYRGPAPERFLVVKTAKGFTYVSPSEIAAVETEDEKTTQRKPILVVTVAKSDKKPSVFVSYLSHGLAWAPSYRVDISDPKSLQIEMATVLRNEMADFADAEVSLISGFPSVEFANVSSPLQAQTAWTRFFQELSQRGSSDHEILRQQPLANAMGNFAPVARLNLAATPEGEGVDLHFEPIGKRSLLQGEALSLGLGKAKADYERIVEWTVAPRDTERKRGHELAKDELWDVLHFKNPFKFPLTTAPATVVENGKFNGQRTCYWTNVGEETNLRVTRSLSVRTLCLEEEDKSKPHQLVAVGRHNYTLIHLKGELVVNNHRKEAIKVHIIYSVHGNVLSAAEEPRIVAREGTLTDINPTRDVVWVVTLQPGQEKRLAYNYSTLVDR